MKRKRGAVVDTCFWFALYDRKDQYHSHAMRLIESFPLQGLLIPWPTLFEVINTEFAERPASVMAFKSVLVRNQESLIDDQPYREQAFAAIDDWVVRRRRPLSLVDIIIRLMLDDEDHIEPTHMITFNQRDFVDICARRGIQFEPLKL